jgi:zinc transport system substrate-binding protein
VNKKLLAFVGFVVIATFLSIALVNKIKTAPPSNKLQVTTSFYPLYYFASEIGGDKATVTNITPAGTEPHDYEPTPADVAAIEKSKLLILNGGGLEVWADNIKQNMSKKQIVIKTVGENFTSMRDPHVWLSPQLAQKQVDLILDGFIETDPTNASYYRQNAESLKAKLANLDNEYKYGLSNCKQKDFVTSHEAFTYLADAYNLKQVSIAGLSPDEEPSASKLVEVAKFAKTNNVKYIFFESLVSPKLSRTIASEIGAKTLVLNPIEGLTSDEMTQGKNYVTMMQENLANLRIALQCQ